MEAEATVESMMSTIHAHPTLYEAVGEASTLFTACPSMPNGRQSAHYAALRVPGSRAPGLAGSFSDSAAVR